MSAPTRALQAAWLVGLSCEYAADRRLRAAALATARALVGLVLVVALDLWLAGVRTWRRGRHHRSRPTPNRATARMFVQARLGSGRFLSFASEDYELKEAPDYREWLADCPSRP